MVDPLTALAIGTAVTASIPEVIKGVEAIGGAADRWFGDTSGGTIPGIPTGSVLPGGTVPESSYTAGPKWNPSTTAPASVGTSPAPDPSRYATPLPTVPTGNAALCVNYGLRCDDPLVGPELQRLSQLSGAPVMANGGFFDTALGFLEQTTPALERAVTLGQQFGLIPGADPAGAPASAPAIVAPAQAPPAAMPTSMPTISSIAQGAAGGVAGSIPPWLIPDPGAVGTGRALLKGIQTMMNGSPDYSLGMGQVTASAQGENILANLLYHAGTGQSDDFIRKLARQWKFSKKDFMHVVQDLQAVARVWERLKITDPTMRYLLMDKVNDALQGQKKRRRGKPSAKTMLRSFREWKRLSKAAKKAGAKC